MSDSSLTFLREFCPGAEDLGLERHFDHPWNSRELTGVAPGRIATVVQGNISPMIVDLQTMHPSGPFLRVVSFGCGKERGEKLEWEGPANGGFEDDFAGEMTDRMRRLGPPHHFSESWRDLGSVASDLVYLGSLLSRHFWLKIAMTREDPIMSLEAVEDYLATMINKVPLVPIRGNEGELRRMLQALMTHVGAGTEMILFSHHKGVGEASYTWLEEKVRSKHEEILRTILRWFEPQGESLTRFAGNRWSDLMPGPAIYRIAPENDADPSAHDRLEAYETLVEFLKCRGLGEEATQLLS